MKGKYVKLNHKKKMPLISREENKFKDDEYLFIVKK